MTRQSQDNACIDRLKALADPTRFRVVKALGEGPKRVGELETSLEIEQSLLSHHLKILRDAQIVSTSRDGKSIIYRVAKEFEHADINEGIDLDCCKIVF